MKRIVIVCILLVSFLNSFSQSTNLWGGYFSYAQISDLTESNTKIFAAAENSYFSKSITTNDLITYNTVDGLSGSTITTFYYSSTSNKTFVGYENGLINIVNEADKSVIQVVDIINKGGVPPNIKRINHFYEHNNKLYISCDFGIVVYDLTQNLFGDTYFIGPGGQQVSVLQTAVLNNRIYAVTLLNGLKSADLSSPNLIDFNLWTVINPDFWKKIATFNNQIIVLNNNNRIYRYTGTAFNEVYNLNATWIDMRAKGNYLVTCTATTATVLNENFVPVLQITTNQIPDFESIFTSVSFLNSTFYIGSSKNGLVEVLLNQPNNPQIVLPNGPFFNNIFSIQMAPSANFLWAVYGDYSESYNPYPLDEYGVSKFSDGQWLNIPYEDLQEAKSITRAVINPNNENQTYFSSYFSGVLKFENNLLTTLYNNTTPNGPESLVIPGNPAYVDIRMNGSVFDRNGNVWFTNSFINNAMKVLRSNGQWQSYSIATATNNALVLSYGRMVIDRNNTKWFVSNREGAFGFNENSNPQFKKIISGDEEGYPFTDTRAIAIDNRNQLWIGSVGGLRVLSNISQFNSPNDLVSRPIIFVEDDLPQELLADQFITDIAVDGANNKWIGTADAGVFLFSPNGQETLQRFTVDNSPLPSNFINDIDINSKTGEVFFATNKGMVSFKGTATTGSDNLSNVVIYPNPVRPGYTGTVKITGLLDKANVKVTDISGNLVFEQVSAGGTIEWDTTAFGKYKVASGVYMIFITSDDATETKVSKVMIIR
jgi:hypothetical protein